MIAEKNKITYYICSTNSHNELLLDSEEFNNKFLSMSKELKLTFGLVTIQNEINEIIKIYPDDLPLEYDLFIKLLKEKNKKLDFSNGPFKILLFNESLEECCSNKFDKYILESEFYVQNILKTKYNQDLLTIFRDKRRILRLSIFYEFLTLNLNLISNYSFKSSYNEYFEFYLTQIQEIDSYLNSKDSHDYLELVEKCLLTPNPDKIPDDYLNTLKIENEGESKKIIKVNKLYNISILKPSIYSHKQQKSAIIEGSDMSRITMTKNILYLLEKEGINHSYLYLSKNKILAYYIDPEIIPQIEVIVKRCFVGTDKHRYHELNKYKIRKDYFSSNNKSELHGLQILPKLDILNSSNLGLPNDKIVNEKYNSEYPELLVRFDFRNPNFVNGNPKGDECLYDDLADYFIDTKKAKRLALYTFQCLIKNFEKMGIYFQDICFIITSDGLMHFYEISQDCGRYKKISEDGLSDLDKDIWRSGGSSELVLEKWNIMAKLTKEYTIKHYN